MIVTCPTPSSTARSNSPEAGSPTTDLAGPAIMTSPGETFRDRHRAAHTQAARSRTDVSSPRPRRLADTSALARHQAGRRGRTCVGRVDLTDLVDTRGGVVPRRYRSARGGHP